MKVVACARVLNEERNIVRFLNGYSFCDRIVLADGGSTDATLELASTFPKVEVIHFTERVSCPKDPHRWANDENLHANYLFAAGLAEKPDVLVYDDVDDVPNYLLRENARQIIESSTGNLIMAYRLYCWMDTHYFPQISLVGHSIWAWKPSEITFWASGTDPFSMEYSISGDRREHNVDLPLCLLHHGWPTPEAVAEKMARYKAWGRPQTPPLEACGPLELLPEYAHE